MAKGELISFRVNPELKRDAQALFDYFGVNMSWALTAFLTQCVREQQIPLRFTKNLKRVRVTKEEMQSLLDSADRTTLEEMIDNGEPDEAFVLDVATDSETEESS